jgi:hypothetical protein
MMTAPTGDPATARRVPESRQPLRSLLGVLLLIAIAWRLPHGRTLLDQGFWGSVIATLSFAILALGLWFAVRPSRLWRPVVAMGDEKAPAGKGRSGAKAADNVSPSAEGRIGKPPTGSAGCPRESSRHALRVA